jgi:hypothetical protein
MDRGQAEKCGGRARGNKDEEEWMVRVCMKEGGKSRAKKAPCDKSTATTKAKDSPHHASTSIYAAAAP